jgi:hypothetical protein
MATFTWKPNTETTPPTGYLLERSVDGGLSWTTITTIAHTIPGPDYETDTGLFKYVDAGTVAGEIVRIQAVDSGDSTRDSNYKFSSAAPGQPATVHLFGVVNDAITGEVRDGVPVYISPVPAEASTFVPSEGAANPSSITGRPVLGMKRPVVMYTDDNGCWSIDILRGVPVELRIPSVGFTLAFRTPLDRDLLNAVDAYVYRLGKSEGARTPYVYGVNSGFVT